MPLQNPSSIVLALGVKAGLPVGPHTIGNTTIDGVDQSVIAALWLLLRHGHDGEGLAMVSLCRRCRTRQVADAVPFALVRAGREGEYAVKISCACSAWLTGQTFSVEQSH